MYPKVVAEAFVEHYYNLYDSNRASLAGLYQEGSMLNFQGEKIQGVQNIMRKLTSLPFQQCKHNIYTFDWQPSGPAGGMLIFVSGSLQLPGEQQQLKFSEIFHLMPTPAGGSCVFVMQMSPFGMQMVHLNPTPAGSFYYISNNIFRINDA